MAPAAATRRPLWSTNATERQSSDLRMQVRDLKLDMQEAVIRAAESERNANAAKSELASVREKVATQYDARYVL
jgi:hypothetical protein